jgi:fatty-acyl-CoA synthase
MSTNPYETDLDRNPANFAALTPLSFLERAASVYPDRVAIVHGPQRQTWAATYARCRRLASALAARGLGVGDTVAVMLPNIPAMYEVHFGVPMCGAVLNTLNTRLDADTIAFMLKHGGAKVLITDREYSSTMHKALVQMDSPPLVIDVDDSLYEGGIPLGKLSYEDLLTEGDPDWAWPWPADEWQAIALNYTSGTTGDPKGVVYHHRGAYLNAIGNILVWSMPQHSVYLWTLPMFHGNGWCFVWSMAMNAGTSVCLRRVEAAQIFEAIRTHKVTHYCGAPVVHQMLINAPAELRRGISHKVQGMVAGAAPPAAILEGMAQMGFAITHVYGLTETYGPATVCAKQTDWSDRSLSDQAILNARQGVRYPVQEGVEVMNPETMESVPRDGKTMGEIMFRGNITMKGYLKNPKASADAFAGGWFHTGDLGVIYPDGYIKIRDRSKDIIISGGENISSIEVEDALYRHPAVMACGVVAAPDPKWGETPCAFVELRTGESATEADIIAHCRAHLAPFKIPRKVVFGEVPKTSTGKIQKFALRERAKSASAIE